jgi:prepilin-type N-terminal cleavage/methylation domain-containing protein
MKSNSSSSYSRLGFTLFEIAIVMVIIGLLVGGVLVGQNLVESAAVKGTMKQIAHYDSAIENFQTRYNKLPGDTS